jgi:hypothetical protein
MAVANDQAGGRPQDRVSGPSAVDGVAELAIGADEGMIQPA